VEAPRAGSRLAIECHAEGYPSEPDPGTLHWMSDFGDLLRSRFNANRRAMTPAVSPSQRQQREQRAEAERRAQEEAEQREHEEREAGERVLRAGRSSGKSTPWGAP
jgi:hypothetical protein